MHAQVSELGTLGNWNVTPELFMYMINIINCGIFHDSVCYLYVIVCNSMYIIYILRFVMYMSSSCFSLVQYSAYHFWTIFIICRALSNVHHNRQDVGCVGSNIWFEKVSFACNFDEKTHRCLYYHIDVLKGPFHDPQPHPPIFLWKSWDFYISRSL